MDDTVHANSQANPYAPPQAELALPRPSVGPSVLREMAQFQRGVLLSVLVYLVLLTIRFATMFVLIGAAIASEMRSANASLPMRYLLLDWLTVSALLATLVVAAYYLFRLTARVYSTFAAGFCALVTFVPCVGLVILLFISSRATRRLRDAGYQVGWLGAMMSQFDRDAPA